MNFAEFREYVAQPGPLAASRSEWVREPGLRIYMRGPMFAHGANYILANIEADHFGHGAFTHWLNEYEPQFQFYIENILNPRLARYLERRNYTVVELAGLGGLHMIGPPVVT